MEQDQDSEAQEQDSGVTPAFSDLTDQFTALRDGPGATVTAGHLDLGADLWFSADPAGQAVMTHAPAEHGVRLSLEAGDSGAWACLGMRLPLESLRQARYLGLLVVVRSEGLVSFTPRLRYFLEAGGMRNLATPEPVILAGGRREHLVHLPIDPDLVAKARECELNLFFHNDAFSAVFHKVEPLLIR